MPQVDRMIREPLPPKARVYLLAQTLLTFGETMTMGSLTPNLVQEMQQQGAVVPNIERHDEGWFTTRDRRVVAVKRRGGRG